MTQYNPLTNDVLESMKSFSRLELLVVLEVSRIALADEDIAGSIGEQLDMSYDSIIDLHDKVVDTLGYDDTR